jgi:hypothetical protein
MTAAEAEVLAEQGFGIGEGVRLQQVQADRI